MHGTAGFRFRESEVEELRILLGEFGILERLGQQSDLVLRLKAAGLVKEERVLERFVTYFLTPEGKATIKQALG